MSKNKVNEVQPKELFKRIIIIVPFFIIIGLIALFFDKVIGSSLIFAGIIGLVVGYYKYKQLKKRDLKAAKNTVDYFFIVMGFLMILLGILTFIFEKEIFNEVALQFGLGIIFLTHGLISLKHTNAKLTSWKEIPLGYKIIFIYSLISIIINLVNLENSFNSINIFFGIILNQNFSILLNFIYFLIPIITIFLIYERRGYYVLLLLYVFILFNGITTLIRISTLTLAEILFLTNSKMPNLAQESISVFETHVKNIIYSRMMFGLIIILIIIIYIYFKKDYFKSKNYSLRKSSNSSG